MMKAEPIARSELLSTRTAVFGLAGVSVAYLLHIFGVTPLNPPMRVALYCFVISIPLLVGLGLALDIAGHWPDPDIPFDAHFAIMPLWMGPCLTIAGITSCLWQYEIGAALAFLGVSAAAAVMLGLFQHRLKRPGPGAGSGASPRASTRPESTDV